MVKTIKFFLLMLGSAGSLHAQEPVKPNLIGAWAFNKVSLVNHENVRDSIEMQKTFTGMTLRFKEENKYETSRKINGVVRKVEEGKYTMSADGKKIYQNDEEEEIVTLNEQELALKIGDGIIIHYKKVQ